MPFLSPEDLPDSRIEPTSPALQEGSPSHPLGASEVTVFVYRGANVIKIFHLNWE